MHRLLLASVQKMISGQNYIFRKNILENDPTNLRSEIQMMKLSMKDISKKKEHQDELMTDVEINKNINEYLRLLD